MIIITGQTATGKTKLALALAKKYHGELINFDSRQIYKYLDIITGKDKEKISNIKNQRSKMWLYDVVKPNQYFSSFDFVKKVIPIIKDIEKRGKTPILVGGTYLYIKHLLYGFEDSHSPPNFKLRDQLNDKSVAYLQKMLIKLNKKVFDRLNHSDRLNPRRLIRKIEIETGRETGVETSGIPTACLPAGKAGRRPFGRRTLAGKKARQAPFPFQIIGLEYKSKSKLRAVIEKRVAKRLKQGAVKEVRKLLEMGYSENDPGLKTIGYQQIIKYLNKKLTREEAIEDWINKEVQYAKRQLTFMKKDKNIKWGER